ncbi:hypothetical protein RhiLY_13973 [Ceratobasidium sp. AG-Ba]|nr:hypothetical protein RhiLY_13973 [Ceratobasidium sp. AG-Ba]
MSIDSTTSIFLLFGTGVVGFILIWFALALYIRRRRRLAPTTSDQDPTLPNPQNSRSNRDPVIRAEAGESIEGLPKYSAQAQGDEQTVDRNANIFELMNRLPNWMRGPGASRQPTLPTLPPPAYNPSAPVPSS